MKTLIGITLATMLSVGVHASPQNAGGKETNRMEQEISVEILDSSPEFKSGENGTIKMSSAFITQQNDSSEELFGSFWAELELKRGGSNEEYEVEDWNVIDIRMVEDLSPEDKAQIEKTINKKLETFFDEIPKSKIDEVLKSSDNSIDTELNNEAPPVIYSNNPSALVVVDGEPYYEELDKRYSKVSNAAAFIIKDNKNDLHYMYGGGLWFSSENTLSGWEYTDNVPSGTKRVVKKHAPDLYDSMQNEQVQAKIVPDIIVTTEPSVLISTEGSPKYVLIPNTNLVFVENSNAELFRDLNTNNFYSLFSGRWFVSDKLEGKWQYVAPDDLPEDFAKIPEDHKKSSVLVSVPGTKAAVDAVRDAQIPQITKKDISTTLDKKIEYNGNPEFAEIEGTPLKYAVNTSSAILLWNNKYYLVDDAVWYSSSTPNGPWQIATQRPEGVENIPADNPLYNIKHVYVYKNTDRTVYTGYTSGYTGSYINGPTIVFGTGFHYRGWYGHYYHHPMTYVSGFFYDSFYGWVPVYSPWYSSSFYWHWNWRWNWYGYRPPMYRPPYHQPPHHKPPHHRPPYGQRPDRPIDRPSRPGQPSILPIEEGTRPSRPVTRPSRPSVTPERPNVRPTRPATRPVQPSVRPSRPVTRPSQPAMRPSRPSLPAARPMPSSARMR
ncbi:hypothetical protein OU798_06460 [Prolixibacteraceae bacterium Z1-6]|uniref:Carbohydrate-binding family V/XII n=1 Tax=Draconibacterium aestuarii TaxID=2998507 RepID=A0A9X3FCC3_9BACT|nr:hypothetical protein [Prolixibacteraceae bacterium Z1-6]